MKLFFSLFFLFIFCSTLVLAQNNSTLSDDSEETLLEQNLALAAENSPGITNSPPFTGLMAQVTHPLFIGVDDVTVPAYVGNVTNNEWLQAFLGYEVWGAAYDNVNNKVYFNSGTVLYEWEVSSGIVTQLGTITDTLGAAQSLVSLAFYNGVLYGTKNISNEAVYEINTTTYVATVVIDYTDADFDFGGLAVDPNTGEFYGTNDDTSPNGSGLFRINMDGTGTLITAYPSGQTDIDGLAVSDNGIAYLVIDEPGDIFVYDLVGGTYLTPLTNPWTSAEVFSGGTWIYESGGMSILLIYENSTGADSVETWLNALGETYTRVTNTEALAMPTSDWLTYDAAYYIGIPSSGAEQDSCAAYLNAGGNLLVCDNDVGYSYGTTPWYHDYLMSDYVSDAGSDGTITGMDIMAGLTLDISADPYPDDVLEYAGTYGTGVPIFLAPTATTYSGMRGPGGTFRTQYLCWDPQYSGTSYADKLALYSRTYDWLAFGIIPVELTSFTATVNQNKVELNWVTATETNNQGFEIERNSGSGFEKVGYIPGYGTTTEEHSYSFTDAVKSSGNYSYRLKQIDFNGTYEYSKTIEVEVVVPNVYSLAQNYPNPFNPSTKITFSLAADSKVTLKVFDVLGQEVASLVNQEMTAGVYNVDFNATGFNSGVYFYRIEANGVNNAKFVDVKKMILMK